MKYLSVFLLTLWPLASFGSEAFNTKIFSDVTWTGKFTAQNEIFVAKFIPKPKNLKWSRVIVSFNFTDSIVNLNIERITEGVEAGLQTSEITWAHSYLKFNSLQSSIELYKCLEGGLSTFILKPTQDLSKLYIVELREGVLVGEYEFSAEK
jgi:hypothetical protein